MIGSYYFWKWADNVLPGRPLEVHAALLRGEMHPALQTFDARGLLKKLETAAVQGRKRCEEWDWQITPRDDPKHARFVFVMCPSITQSEEIARRFSSKFSWLGLSGCDEASGHVIPCLRPKLNRFISGQEPDDQFYDVTAEDLPFLIKRIDAKADDPFGILEDGRGYFVQCLAHGRRFVVEWAQNEYSRTQTKWDQWRAQDAERLAAAGGINVEGCKFPDDEEPDFVRYSDTLRIFEAFLRGESRPAKCPWRNINYIVSKK